MISHPAPAGMNMRWKENVNLDSPSNRFTIAFRDIFVRFLDKTYVSWIS